MVQCREPLRFALEARQTLGNARDRLRQDFDRDVAMEDRIAGAIDLTIPPAPMAE